MNHATALFPNVLGRHFARAWPVVKSHADYDALRLAVYAERPENRGRIAVRRVGRAVAMRFADVGYFNQVYHADVATLARWGEIEDFFAGGGHRPKIYVTPGEERSRVEEGLRARGFAPGYAVVRLDREVGEGEPVETRGVEIAVEPVGADAVDEFFGTYLDAFGAVLSEPRRAAALANLRGLYGRPELGFWLARCEGEAAGVGLMYRAGDLVFFSGGATLERFRGRGVQTALIAARLRAARETGARRATSWAEHGGRSERNLVRAGFTVVYADAAWSRPQGEQGHEARG